MPFDRSRADRQRRRDLETIEIPDEICRQLDAIVAHQPASENS
jgi:hypothetical protein